MPQRSCLRPWWLLALLACALSAARAEEPRPRLPLTVDLLRLGPAAAILTLPPSPMEAPLPVVVLLADAEGPGPRSSPYGERLLENGVALLEPDFTGNTPDGAAAAPPEVQLRLALAAIAADPRLDPRRVVVLGLGQGARGALLGLAAGAPVAGAALLYPGCDAALDAAARRVPEGARVLLLHGDADAANALAACAALARAFPPPATVAHRVLAGASYGWDATSLVRPGGAAWLPHPAEQEGRAWARPDPLLTEVAADRVLGFVLLAVGRQ